MLLQRNEQGLPDEWIMEFAAKIRPLIPGLLAEIDAAQEAKLTQKGPRHDAG